MELVDTWKSEDNLPKSVLTFHPVGPQDRAEVVRLDSKHFPTESSRQPERNVHEIKLCGSFQGP